MRVIGTNRHDVLVGSPSPFADVIRGKGGADIILGNGGEDKIFGGGGADTFIFNLADANGGVSRIIDFEPGHDTLIIIPNEAIAHFPPEYTPDSGLVSVSVGDGVLQPIVKITEDLNAPSGLLLGF